MKLGCRPQAPRGAVLTVCALSSVKTLAGANAAKALSSARPASQRRRSVARVAAIVLGVTAGISLVACTSPDTAAVKTTGSTSQSAADDESGATADSAERATGEAEAQPEASSSPTAQPAIKPEPPGSVGPLTQPELPVVKGKLDKPIKLPSNFTVSLESVTATTVTAETPGEVSGAAIEVVVRVTNESDEAHHIDSAVVSLETDDGELGIPTIAGGPIPLLGELSPQAHAEGHYLFMLDPAEGRDVTIRVNYAAGEPVAQFTGRTP